MRDVLQKQVAAAIQTPAIKQKLIEFGIEPVGSTSQAYAELLQKERARWQKVIKEQSLTLD